MKLSIIVSSASILLSSVPIAFSIEVSLCVGRLLQESLDSPVVVRTFTSSPLSLSLHYDAFTHPTISFDVRTYHPPGPQLRGSSAVGVDEDFDKYDDENNIALFAETANNDIKCIWSSPFQACKGQYPVLYTCSVAKYSKVCCTVSSITKPKFNTYGQCTKGGSVPAPTPPAPKPTQANLQCIWNSPFKECTGQHPVLYSCSVAKYSKVCCTVSTIHEANMSPYGRCTFVPNDLEIKVE